MNRINLICLGVRDMARSLEFYKKLGFQTTADKNAPVIFFNNQGTKLELFPLDALAQDINKNNLPIKTGFSGITLSCNMKSKEEVDSFFNRLKNIGGIIAKEPQTTDWGGYSGYFQDPDGYYWEVAYGKDWQFDENDMLIIK